MDAQNRARRGAQPQEPAPPTVADWQNWLQQDLPSTAQKVIDALPEGPLKQLLLHAEMPTVESDCVELIADCLFNNKPTLLANFVMRSTVTIKVFAAVVTDNRAAPLATKTMKAFSEHFLKTRGHQLTMFRLACVDLGNREVVGVLCEGLRFCNALEDVKLGNCMLDADRATAVWQVLKASCKKLARLSLSDNHLGDPIAQTIGSQLKDAPALHDLALVDCGIAHGGAMALATALQHNTTLQKLKLGDNALGDDGGAAILASLRASKSVTTLDLMGCHLGSNSASELARLLKANTGLLSLRLGDNDLQALAAPFGDALKANKTLKHLDLFATSLTEQAIVHIAHALKTNTSLTTLIVDANPIGAAGVQAIADGLPHAALQLLSLEGCEIDGGGCERILRALTNNKALTSLDLGRCTMGVSACTAVSELLRRNTSLKMLKVDGCGIDDLGLAALSRGLVGKISLRSLDLSSNLIGDEGVLLLSQTLEGNVGIVELHMAFNPFDVAMALHRFAAALKKNASLANFDHHYFEGAANDDLAPIDKRLRTNANLSDPRLREYLLTIVKRFAQFKIKASDLGYPLWQALCDATDLQGEFAALRSALRLTEVNRAVYLGPEKAAALAASEALAARAADPNADGNPRKDRRLD